MAKMYYSADEAVAKLSVDEDGLAALVEEGKLTVYADGANKVYRVVEVDALAAPGETAEVELTPAGEQDAISLSEADQVAPAGKEDTVITAEGISIFDDEDLEVESADPMAKTSIAPSVEDQISLEGVGSGSGLLDLTRESDDTSLGAEVLDHIDAEMAIPSSAGVEAAISQTGYAEAEPAVIEMPAVVEEVDPSAGAFAGLVAAGALVMLVASAVAVAAMLKTAPAFVTALQENIMVFVVASLAVGILLAVAGYFFGKSMASRAEALQRG